MTRIALSRRTLNVAFFQHELGERGRAAVGIGAETLTIVADDCAAAVCSERKTQKLVRAHSKCRVRGPDDRLARIEMLLHDQDTAGREAAQQRGRICRLT